MPLDTALDERDAAALDGVAQHGARTVGATQQRVAHGDHVVAVDLLHLAAEGDELLRQAAGVQDIGGGAI